MIPVSGYATAPWSDFAVAVVGAAAALTGLLFVAVSLNIDRILALATLAGRSGSTLILFAVPLTVGVLVLIPDQPATALGLELVATGLAAGGALLSISARVGRGPEEPRVSWLLLRLGTSITVAAFLLVAGVTVIVGSGGGLYWVAPAVLEAFVAGLMTAWILLVEIRR